ncbi:MAG: serine protease, partial [Saprospiraceae bacterium]
MKNFSLFILLCCLFSVTTNAQQLDHVQGDFLVQISKEANILTLERNLGTFEGKPTRLKVVKEASKPFRIWLINFDHTTINEADFLAHLWRQPEVEVAQVNHLISKRQTVPDDTDFNQQWHWVNDGSMGGTADADVDADLVWDLTTGGQTQTGNHEIVVCVIEGANYNHEDLIDNHWVNNAEIPDDGIDNDDNGYIDDYHGWNPAGNNDDVGTGGHGTQVNGMIGAVGNNMQGATGINWNVKIMNVDYANTQEANVIAAYTYPYLMRKEFNESGGVSGAFVVSTNASWGIDGGDPDSAPLWCSFYDTLGTVGILNCGATTNSNLDVDAVGDLPTACPSDFMVSVARTGISDNHAGGFGLTQIDFGAPGINVYTTSGNGGYGTTTGTSFSSPLTAGVIGLLYSTPCSAIGTLAITDPEGTALAIKDAIMQGVDIIPSMEGISVTGGRINAFNAMQIIMANCGPCPQPGAVQFTNVIDTLVDVSWSSGDSTLMTNLRYREIGAADWTDVENAMNPLTIDGLLVCTEYELQLEDICMSD